MVISIITRIIVGVILSFHLPLNVAAQKSGTKIPHIGYIGMTPRPPDEAFRKGLQELGYNEGQNIVIEYHWIERSGRTAAQEADDLVRSKPDVIVAVASPSTRAVMDATRTIPIVFVDIGDPVAYGFVTNLAVEPQEVVPGQAETTDRCLCLQATMGSMPVVAMEPVGQFGGSVM